MIGLQPWKVVQYNADRSVRQERLFWQYTCACACARMLNTTTALTENLLSAWVESNIPTIERRR